MRIELKRTFTSPLFYLSFIVLLLCLQGYSLPTYYDQIFGGWIDSPEQYESALTMTLGGILFGGGMLLLPFCAAMTYATTQVDELRSSMTQWSMLRSSVGGYAAKKIVASFLSSAVAAGGAFAPHAILWNILAQPYDPIAHPNHLVGFSEKTLFHSWSTICYALPIYIEITLVIAFAAGCWSIVALASSVWVPDKLLVTVVPLCINKLWGANLP